MAVEYETLVQGGHSKFAEEIFKKIAPVEVESDEGNPITIVTDSAQIAKNTHLTFEPTQDLHGYDHPWPAGGGKNLLATNPRTETFSGVTVVINTDGTILVNGTSTDSSYFRIATNMNLTISESIKYSVVSSNDSLFYQFGFDKKDSSIADTTTASFGTDLTINNPSNVGIIWVRLRNNTTYNNVKLYPMIRLASESDATFEPYSNICPISGLDEVEVKRTGKNLIDAKDVTMASSGDFYPWTQVNLPAGTYTLSMDSTASSGAFQLLYNDSPIYIGQTVAFTMNLSAGHLHNTFTVSATMPYVKLYNNTAGTFSNIQLELGSSATDYEPYTEQTVTESLPETVYGGTLDLETGELTVDKAIISYTSNAGFASHYSDRWYYDGLPSGATRNVASISNQAEYRDAQLKYGAYFFFGGSGFYVNKLSADETLADFGNRLASTPLQICYSLATPITYTLTPKQLSLLKGTNHISANAKSVKVTFRAGQLATLEDVAGAVKIADEHLETALTPILGDFATVETSPASASHAVGEYLIYNKRLYKVLSSISAGQQLTIGTNVGQTNVAAELASQANAISALNSNWVYLNSSDYASHEAYLRAIVSVTSAYKPYIVSSKTSGSPLQIGMFIKKDDNNAEILLAHDSGIRMYYLNNNTFSEYTCAKKSD